MTDVLRSALRGPERSLTWPDPSFLTESVRILATVDNGRDIDETVWANAEDTVPSEVELNAEGFAFLESNRFQRIVFQSELFRPGLNAVFQINGERWQQHTVQRPWGRRADWFAVVVTREESVPTDTGSPVARIGTRANIGGTAPSSRRAGSATLYSFSENERVWIYVETFNTRNDAWWRGEAANNRRSNSANNRSYQVNVTGLPRVAANVHLTGWGIQQSTENLFLKMRPLDADPLDGSSANRLWALYVPRSIGSLDLNGRWTSFQDNSTSFFFNLPTNYSYVSNVVNHRYASLSHDDFAIPVWAVDCHMITFESGVINQQTNSAFANNRKLIGTYLDYGA